MRNHGFIEYFKKEQISFFKFDDKSLKRYFYTGAFYEVLIL